MKKRTWAAVLCLCMVFSLLPGTARAATSGTCGANVTWELNDGILTISGIGPMASYSNSSGQPWYSYRSSIQNIIIGDGVTSIGSFAFSGAQNLTKITVGDNVSSIGKGAFGNCSNLRGITLPESITSIGEIAFVFSGLRSITIPDSVVNIDVAAFQGCSDLVAVKLPKELKYMGNSAFIFCSSLKDVNIPDGLTTIEYDTFSGCTSLSAITIPNGVMTIDTGAFANTSLTHVTIPASVTTIGGTGSYDSGSFDLTGSVFRDCSQLTEILIDAANPNYASQDGVIFSKNMNRLLCCPPGKGGSYAIPNGVSIIGDTAFSTCTNLSNIIIPGSLGDWNRSGFSGCTGLISVTISEGVSSIPVHAFGGCTSLTEINMPTSLTSIGNRAFVGCTSLSDVVLPSGVVNIGDSAFEDCTNLSNVVLQEGVAYIGEDAFRDCKNLTRLVLPDSLTSIGNQALFHCTGLTSAGPVGGDYSIQMGWKTAIPNYAFNCAMGGEGYDPNQMNITSVTIPDGVTTIGCDAFYICSPITSVTIPRSVTTIDGTPFPSSSVKDVYYAGSKEDWENISISTLQYVGEPHWLDSATIHYGEESNPNLATIQSLTLTKNGTTFDLLTQTAEFEENATGTADVSVTVNWGDEETGRTFLIQDKDTYVELPASFVPGTKFAPDAPIYVIATNAAADTLLDWKEIKLQIVQSIPPTAPQISITPETLDLSVGKTEDITVTTIPTGARYTLTSSDLEVVSVSGTTLAAHKLGRAEITAALVDHPGVTAVCSVAVKDGYDDLMCAIAACQLSYENELTRYAFGAKVSTFTEAAIGPNRLLWNGYTDATLSDFYKDVLGDWEIVDVVSKSSGLFAVALDNPDTNQRIIAYRGTEANTWADLSADAQLAVLNKLSPQFGEAMDFYTKNSTGNKNILLTGYSLGGALACYVSLQTGERAELFNGANGLIIEDSYFIGGEEIYNHFHGANRWNFTNHVTDVATVSVNYPIAYPNAGKLPVEVHEPSSLCSSASLMGLDGHSLFSMLEYDESTARFRLTDGTPYSQTLSDVREFEMTRVDALYFMRKAIDVYQLVKNPAEFILEQLIFSVSGLQGYLEEHVGAYEKVFFSFGSSGDDTIAIQKIIEQVFLFGGDGNDFLTGGCINDVLVGGLGTNAMDGGPMNDLYVITGTSDQYINDCSGVDDIYIPSGVRISSYGNPTDKVDGYYVLTLTNGQRIMINENRKQGSDNRFRVYSMDGTYCGSYKTVPQETEAQMMALAVEDETVETSETLPVTTLEFSGKNLVLNVQDSAGNTVGTVDTTSDTFPLYRPYGYFYYDSQDETMRAHLFGGTGEVQVSSTSQAEQTVECAYIFHAASDDLPLKRFTANIAVGSSDTILTPSCSVQEPAVPFRLMDGNGDIQNIPVKTEDLTVSETPSTPDQPTESPNQPGGSTDTPPSNSSGGGGSSSSNSYSISTPTRVTGGTIQVSPSSAQKGATVTITVTPNSGYELDRLTVTDSRGNEIKLTAQGGGKYTFTMPGRAVTVKAAFAPLPDDTEKLCDGGADCPSRGFTDLGTVGAWYHEAVDYVLRNNLMGGYGSGVFGPNDTLTRAQFAQILYNKEGRPAVTGGSIFTDVAPGAWYAPAITWAAERGIVGGYGNGMFGPDDNITREQLTVMLWRYAGNPAATDKELHFTDADKASGYALEALRWAVENGVMGGYGNGQLAPQGLATRAQAAQMLKNYLER